MAVLDIQNIIKEYGLKLYENTKSCKNDFFFSGIESITEAKNEVSYLLCFVLNKDKVFLIAHNDYVLSENEFDRFMKCFERRAKGEPLAYITGKKNFFGYDFFVENSTLIPRADTEILVEEAIAYYEGKNFCPDTPCCILDFGTGTGCILLSIMKECNYSYGIGLDINTDAVELATKNAKHLAVAERCMFANRDFTYKNFSDDLAGILYDFMQVSGKPVDYFDMIVSNPPYIPDVEYGKLDISVRDFEPKTALVSGDLADMTVGGLYHAQKVMELAEKFLKPGGLLLMEHGYNQGEACRGLCSQYDFIDIKTLYDYAQNERVLYAIKK